MRVFVGSSGEQRRLVDWVTSFILKEFRGQLDPVPWTAPWTGGTFTLEYLLQQVETTDAAILFLTPDDKTEYRGKARVEPRDNLVFEAGLFIATHGRERTRLLVPVGPGDKVAMPTDIQGLTWNGYEWAQELDASGLPNTMRAVCEQLATLGPRRNRSPALPRLVGRENVDQVQTVVSRFVWRKGKAHSSGRLRANKPSCRTATGGMRHGRTYQEAAAAA